MLELFMTAFIEVSNLQTLTLILTGVIVGIIGGTIPGFTVVMAILMVFPFTFAMTPMNGLALMIGVFAGGYSGGMVSGIMLGIPGTPSSITTVYDGYPMAKNGEPGRALGIAVLASFLGTLISLAILIMFGPLIARYSLNFRPWEITALIVFALTLVAGLSNGAILKGLIAAALGLFITMVGYDRNGNLRYDFGISSLSSGFELLPVMIGVFAFSQLMRNLESSDQERATKVETRIHIPYGLIMLDMLKQKVNVLRSSVIGATIGALPGTGGTVANFISYDQAKKASRRPEGYGKGIPDGIVASESSNSAVVGGAFIPTLALGIPGDLPMAIMMGVLILHGISPGPLMFQQNPILIGSIYVSLFIAAIFMIITMFLFMRWFARVSLVPIEILAPLVLLFCAVGAFVLNNNTFDVWVLFIFGIMGYLMDKAGVPLTPLILGIILGSNLEQQFIRALELDSNWTTFFTRPIALTFFVLAAVSVIAAIRQNRRMNQRIRDGQSDAPATATKDPNA